MTDKTKNNLRKGVGIFISVWTVVVGLALIIQAWRIFSHGDGAYTVERIAQHFHQIAVPVYIWLAAVVVGGVLFCVYPAPKEKIVAYVETKCTLERISKRLPANSKEREKYQKQRMIAFLVCAVTVIACVVVSFVYMIADVKLSAESGFLAKHEEAERIIRALVWTMAAIALLIGTGYFTQSAYKKEIVVAKAELAENAKKGVKGIAQEEKTTWQSLLKKKFAFVHNKWFVLGVRITIAVLAVVCIITGILNGGVLAVLEKGVKLCMQCIGIG